MKSKLAASFYLYLAGTCWRNTRSKMPSRLMISFLNCRRCQINCSFQTKGFASSSRATHSAAGNDAFSDLGPASECPAKKVKLATEKHDDFLDDDFLDLGPGISECSAKKINLATEKPDLFPIMLHASSIEDDDFLELGPGISECSAKKIILATEKPDPFPKSRPIRKGSPCKPLSSDNKSSAINVLSAAAVKASTSSGPKIGGNDNSPTCTDDTRKVSHIESPISVSIKNVPSTVGLTELVKAISVFGKVAGASFVNASNKLRCCNIEFEDVDSSRKAVITGQVTVGNRVFPVDRLDAVDLVTIRITNISEKTSDYDIHMKCKSVGELVGLTRTSMDCADAFFNVPYHSTHLDIVNKLKGTTVDLNHWSATSKSKSLEIPWDDEAQYKLGLQISDRISELKRQVDMKKVHLADLEYLNASMMHMEWNPSEKVLL